MVLLNNGNSLFTIVFRFGWQTNWLSASEQLLRPGAVQFFGRACKETTGGWEEMRLL